MKLNYRNITGNLAAIYIFAQTVYPGLNADMILAAILDGSILTHIANLALVWIGYQFGRPEEVKIKYVTE